MAHALPLSQRRKALLIGLFSAIVLRAVALFTVSLILQFAWLEILGAGYLLYIAIEYFTKKKKKKSLTCPVSFWKTVLLIELYDLGFAIDSIIAGVAFIATPTNQQTGPLHPKLWIVYVGGMLGVAAIRYTADLFSYLLGKFRHLENSAYLLIAWIAVKLFFQATGLMLPGFEAIFWLVFILILAGGFLRPRASSR